MKGRQKLRILGAVALVLAAAATAAWRLTPLRELLTLESLDTLLGPFRHHWLAGPLVCAIYVAAGLVFVPVLLLVLLTGILFGPWLGALYALAGSMASAAVGYGLGHALGKKRLERWGGRPVKRLSARLAEQGVMVVFLARKVPAPFTLVNLVAGASRLSFRDYLVGTFLGMGTGVVALAVFGDQLRLLWTHPTWSRAGLALLLFAAPAGVAVLIQKWLKRKRLAPA